MFAVAAKISSDNEEVCVRSPRRSYLVIKRLFDVVASAFGLIILSPLFAAVAILIKREDGGPVFHRRICVSEKGSYIMYKFRTMVTDSDNLEKYLTPEQIQEYNSSIKVANDSRVTKIGHILRKTSIDELPQLISVLKSDMSLIGPRPVTEQELKFYSANELEWIFNVKPGITGYWQVQGRSDATYENGKRQQLELYYANHSSLRMDLKILIKTFKVVVSREGAH